MADCRKCKHNYKMPGDEPRCNRMCDGESDFEPITNAMRIRAMSDEELEKFISKVNRTCIVNALGGDTQCDYEDVNCTECKAKFCGIQKWLQSEAE